MIATVYRKLVQVGKVSGALSFLIAAPYALVQYWQAQNSSRVEQTLNMYKLYNASPFTDYRAKITKALIKYRDKINQAAVTESALTTAESEIVTQEGLEMEIFLVMDFFDGLTVCVKAKLCDDETAVHLFQPRAYDLYLNLHQYIKLQRETSATTDFGSGLEAVARWAKPLPNAGIRVPVH